MKWVLCLSKSAHIALAGANWFWYWLGLDLLAMLQSWIVFPHQSPVFLATCNQITVETCKTIGTPLDKCHKEKTGKTRTTRWLKLTPRLIWEWGILGGRSWAFFELPQLSGRIQILPKLNWRVPGQSLNSKERCDCCKLKCQSCGLTTNTMGTELGGMITKLSHCVSTLQASLTATKTISMSEGCQGSR